MLPSRAIFVPEDAAVLFRGLLPLTVPASEQGAWEITFRLKPILASPRTMNLLLRTLFRTQHPKETF